MKRLGTKYLIIVLVTYLWAFIFDSIHIDAMISLFFFGISMLLVSLIIKPLLLLISLPITIITFGLFSLVVNTWVVLLAFAMIPGISIDGFWPAFVLAASISLINSSLIPKIEEQS